jgi:hypothetical protein
MAPKTKAKAKATPEPEPVEVEPPEVTEEALEAAKQLKLEEKIAMRAAREAEVAEQTAKMNFEAKVNETVEEGRRIEAEIQEAKDLGLSPFKAVRMRRKSKDLETSATDLLGAALDKIFLESDLNEEGQLPTTALQAALATAPGNLKASEETLKPIIRDLNYKRTGKFDEVSTGITLEEFKQIAWTTAVTVREVDVAMSSIAFAAKMKGKLGKNKAGGGGGFAALAAAKAAKAKPPP